MFGGCENLQNKNVGIESAMKLYTHMRFSLLILALAFGSLTGCATMNPIDSNSPKHHTEKGFRNLFIENKPKSLGDMWKWKVSGDGPRGTDKERQSVPRVDVDRASLSAPGTAPQVTWVGHSTVLFQMAGKTVITDPVFSERCSPVSFAGPKRYQAPAMSIPDLPKVDFAVISHNHYDHLDKASVLALGSEVHWLVPLGLKSWFTDLGIERVTELDWWGEKTFDNVRFVATPTQHWSARGLADQFETLWASWLVEIEGVRFWFGGDTGYNDTQFKEIGERFSPIDIAAIPIGAYEPRWFMKQMHVNPEEALMIHQDIGARWSFGIHWGTFQLTDEAPLDPRNDLLKFRDQKGLSEDEFTTLAIGETQTR